MLSWIAENAATIIVTAILLIVIAAVIVKLIRDKKRGRSSCGCQCANCPMAGKCHEKK